jgi:hypothetical protein
MAHWRVGFVANAAKRARSSYSGSGTIAWVHSKSSKEDSDEGCEDALVEDTNDRKVGDDEKLELEVCSCVTRVSTGITMRKGGRTYRGIIQDG